MKRSAIVFVVFLLVLLSLCVFTFKSCTSGSAAGGIGIFSEGERVGYVYKLSQKGTATKSWEGEMVLGPPGLTVFQDEDDKGKRISSVWKFSVVGPTSTETVQQIRNAMYAGEWVVLRYNQAQIAGFAMDTEYNVTGVKPIREGLKLVEAPR